MKKIWLALVFVSFSHFVCSQTSLSQTYLESLDSVIKQQIKHLDHQDLNIIADNIEIAIQDKNSLEKIDELVHSKNFVSFFLLNSCAELQEIKFALGVKIYLYCLECCEQKMLRKSMKIYDSLEYWKNEKFCESRNLLQKNISRWISSSTYHNEIDVKINNLESISHQTLSCLGLVRYNKHSLLTALNRDEFEKKLMAAVQLQDVFLHKDTDDYQVCDIYYVMKNMILQLYAFNSHLSSQYIQSQPPSHLQRNWAAYTSTAVGLCGCAVAYYLYKDDVRVLANNAYEAGTSLWDEHVKQPVGKIKDALLGTGAIPKFDITEEQAQYNALIEQELREPAPCGAETTGAGAAAIQTSKFLGITDFSNKISDWWNSSGQNVAQQQNQEFAEQLACERHRIALQYPEKNISTVMRAYQCTILRQILDVKQQANIVLKEMYEDNRLTIGIASLIPLMTVIAGGTFASQKLYNSVSYQPIRKVIRDLEIFLNDASVQDVSLDREGRLYFLTELLKNKSKILAANDTRLMEDDITELQSMKLTYAQKFNIVQRMYHTYGFLLPGAI